MDVLLEIKERLSWIESGLLSQKNVLTFDEACQFSGISKSFMYKLTSQGKIDHFKNIPVAFCAYMLKMHNVKQIRLYVYLKTICSGHFKHSDKFIKTICNTLGYKCEKTYKSHFEYLLQRRWLTFNSKSGNYRIVGFKQVADRLKFPSSKGTIFYPCYIKRFTGFASAAVITYYMIYRSRKERRPVLSKRSTKKSRLSASLPHTYLAKILNVSKTTAQRYRQQAIDDCFLTTRKNYLKTTVPLVELSSYKKFASVNPEIVRIVNKAVSLQLSDKLTTSIVLRKKRNLRFVVKKFGKKCYR